ncbi:hypothetical protein CARUB_v10016412mg [Capsella rubella]|uniref:F-box domain-containing protein n=2 Tax=Capsella rubella TaxID=81985 RepID=R0I4Z2_9BRAS|nr:hypothetical protein CARUB_v10016412mg [Capsella rubella]
MTTMNDLPRDLVEEILFRVPLTSLGAIRSTCKNWNVLSKKQIIGKKATAARKQFLGFIMMDYRVCSIKFDLQNEGEFVDPSIKQVDILNQVEISRVIHCDGLLLCVTKDSSRLVVWNPYLGKTRWIQPRTSFHRSDRYALGCDENRNHKILRIFGDSGYSQDFGYEIYNFSSNSWKVFYATPGWSIEFCHPQSGVSLKGNAYFLAQTHKTVEAQMRGEVLLPFDFRMEKFRAELPLPFHSYGADSFLSLSCVREEQLAVLYEGWRCGHTVEIWVTNKIDLGSVSWSMFLRSISSCHLSPLGRSFFIDEERKFGVVFDLDNEFPKNNTPCNQTANIIGQDGYFKSVNIREAKIYRKPHRFGKILLYYLQPLVCSSSYVPSLVHLQQINQPHSG